MLNSTELGNQIKSCCLHCQLADTDVLKMFTLMVLAGWPRLVYTSTLLLQRWKQTYPLELCNLQSGPTVCLVQYYQLVQGKFWTSLVRILNTEQMCCTGAAKQPTHSTRWVNFYRCCIIILQLLVHTTHHLNSSLVVWINT